MDDRWNETTWGTTSSSKTWGKNKSDVMNVISCEMCGTTEKPGWYGCGDWSNLWYCRDCWLDSPDFCNFKKCCECGTKLPCSFYEDDKQSNAGGGNKRYCQGCKKVRESETQSCCSENIENAFYPVVKPDWDVIGLPTLHEVELFDAHMHLEGLYDKDVFSKPVDKFLEELGPLGPYGPPEGVDRVTIITSACDSTSIEPTIELFNGLDQLNSNVQLYFSVGWHPKVAHEYTDAIDAQLRSLTMQFEERLVAIGECGLDYSEQWTEEVDGEWSVAMPSAESRQIQIQAFEAVCDLAFEKNLPICIHTREAEMDTLDVIKRKFPADYKLQMHCFGNSRDFLELVLEEYPNCMISFAGHLTYASAKIWMVRPYVLGDEALTRECVQHDLTEMVKTLPLDRILLETDGPYMAPNPFTGTSCVPAHMLITAQCIAEIKEVSLDDVLKQTRINARNFFGV